MLHQWVWLRVQNLKPITQTQLAQALLGRFKLELIKKRKPNSNYLCQILGQFRTSATRIHEHPYIWTLKHIDS